MLATACLVASRSETHAAEYAFSTYGLGQAAFGAGFTPPPGTYVTAATGFYNGQVGGQINFGGVVINAGAKVEGFSNGWNILYVPERKILDGSLGLVVTLPVGHVDVDATIGPLSAQTDGWGFGDIISRAQLGWKRGDSHTLSTFRR